jgi:hypothetical protein
VKKFPIIVFLFAFILCLITPACAQEKVKLEYDFKVGTKLDYKMKIDGDVTIQVNPDSPDSPPANTAKMDGEFTYTHEVTDTNSKEKTAKVNVIYGKSHMHTIVNGQKIPNNDVPLLYGKVAKINVGFNGQVKNYQLPDGLPASLQNADFKNMFTIFPNRVLRLGESWMENSENVNNDNPNYTVTNTLNSTRTLVGIEKKRDIECAKVKVVGNTTTITKSKKPELKLNGKVEARTEGIVYYDLQRGYIVYSEIRNKINNVVTTGNVAKAETGEAKEVTTILNTDMSTVIDLL